MKLPSGATFFALLLLFFVPSVAAERFDKCWRNFTDHGNIDNGIEGGVYFNGTPAPPKDAVGLNYTACLDWCGSGQEDFNWTVFSQQFSAWLLPWLALVSQLPFGAENRLDNLISVALTVGSPTLAAYSLALTAINTRWANDRFSGITYPNHRNAAKALIHLQQVPLRLTTRDGLLASLIVLHENDDWWECVVDRLEQSQEWTIATATSIAWVVIAFIFTIVDSFMNLGNNINSNGQGVGSLWLWLVPIVIGWLWTPVCSYDRLKAAIDKANDIAAVAAPETLPHINPPPDADVPRRAYHVSHRQAIRIYKKKKVFTQDAARAAPVFNYARVWEWSSAVETIARAFEHADKKARKREPVNPTKDWVYPEKRPINHRDNRTGTVNQVQAYCGFPVRGYKGGDKEPVQPLPPGVWTRIFVASVFALVLQWATTGSAVLIVIFTPTTGLGCRSAAYIVYGVVSTMIWATSLLSSYLAHCAKVWHDHGDPLRSGHDSANLAERLATFLRRVSAFAAYCNTIGIVLVCVFQFSNFFNRCSCNSSVMGRGAEHAYYIISTIGYNYDHDPMKGAWIGGVALAGGSVVIFLFFLNLMLEPSSKAIDN